MGLDDLYKNKDKKYEYGYNDHHNHYNHYSDNYHYRQHREKFYHKDQLKTIMSVISNPKLKMILIFGVIMLLLICILILIILVPLLKEFVVQASDNGLKGIFDIIWNGKK